LAQAVQNIKDILLENNLDLKNVVDVTVFLSDPRDYDVFNELYSKIFPKPYPTRATAFVKSLPRNAKVELKVIAHPD